MRLNRLVLDLGPNRLVRSGGVEYRVEALTGGACRIHFTEPRGRAIRVIAPGSSPGWSAGSFERFWVYADETQIARAEDTTFIGNQALRQLLEDCFRALEAEARVVTADHERREQALREGVLSRP